MSVILVLLPIFAGFFVWLAERKLAMKIEIFNDAVKALILFEADATNHKLQEDFCKIDEKRRRSYPYLRGETLIITGQCSGLVSAFFSKDVSKSFDKAFYSVSLEYFSDGMPFVKGLYSLPERKQLINDLSKELSILFIIKQWFYNLINFRYFYK